MKDTGIVKKHYFVLANFQSGDCFIEMDYTESQSMESVFEAINCHPESVSKVYEAKISLEGSIKDITKDAAQSWVERYGKSFEIIPKIVSENT